MVLKPNNKLLNLNAFEKFEKFEKLNAGQVN